MFVQQHPRTSLEVQQIAKRAALKHTDKRGFGLEPRRLLLRLLGLRFVADRFAAGVQLLGVVKPALGHWPGASSGCCLTPRPAVGHCSDLFKIMEA
jgi:hypothetical protein